MRVWYGPFICLDYQWGSDPIGFPWVGRFIVIPRMLNAMKILNKRPSENRKFENDLLLPDSRPFLGELRNLLINSHL